MQPSSVTFDLGKTAHGAPLKLVYKGGDSQVQSIELVKEAASQRDDRVVIYGITADAARRLSEAIATLEKMHGA